MISHFLKAMGFWMWGLVAIGLSVTLVAVNYRMLSTFAGHDASIASKPSPRISSLDSTVEVTSSPAQNPQLSPQKTNFHGLQISRVIAKEMTAAQNALQAGQWTEALKYLDAAETKSGLSPFDVKTIHYFKGFAYIKLNALKAAQAEFERSLATGAVSAEDRASLTRTLLGIPAQTSQYQATIDYGTEMADAGTATPSDLVIVAQSYFQLKDCQNSRIWSDRAVAAGRNGGEALKESLKESLFLLKLQCASDAGDNAAMIPILIELIRLNRRSTYWNTLLRIERQAERDDHNTLMLYRIMYDTGAMTVGSDYIEMAQLLGDAALAGEGQTVLEQAMRARLITDQQRERTMRLLDSFKTRAETYKSALAQLNAEAGKNPAGELDVRLGEIHYGFGDYQSAATVIDRGIQKGQIKHPDEAYVYSGLSREALHDKEAAKEAFSHLKTVPGISPRILYLWQLYAETRL